MRVAMALCGTPALMALGACVQAPAAVQAAGPRASVVVVEGRSFAVRSGAGLEVRAEGAAMGFDEGLIAKRAAKAHCAETGRDLAPAALGRFSGGAWLFDGGCA